MSKPRHYSEQEFEALVRSALDELPIEFQRALEHVAIVSLAGLARRWRTMRRWSSSTAGVQRL